MVTGRMAFPGNSAAVIHDEILNRAPAPLARVNPGLPPELEHIVNKALEKDRKLRYQSAADIRTDLRRLKRDTESAARPRQAFTRAFKSGRTHYNREICGAAENHCAHCWSAGYRRRRCCSARLLVELRCAASKGTQLHTGHA